jgi:N6-adenosine-specific RNA methylase IME4
MDIEAIAGLPIGQLAADQAHLHLWTTNAFLFEAQRVIEAWGFVYKSCLIWIKPQFGNGNYWRVSHEFLLLGVRGNLTFTDKAQQSWLCAERSQHSAKPKAFRKLVERVSPGPRLELFARAQADGWTTWGDQIQRDLFSEMETE